MKKPVNPLIIVSTLVASALSFTGCSTAVGTGAADLGLAGAGGVAGYHLSDGKIGGAAAGAAVGYIGSRIVQSQVRKALSAAEQHGYERAMNQAVKQQYWIIQNQQHSRETTPVPETRLTPLIIPESTLGGVVQNARVEYVLVKP